VCTASEARFALDAAAAYIKNKFTLGLALGIIMPLFQSGLPWTALTHSFTHTDSLDAVRARERCVLCYSFQRADDCESAAAWMLWFLEGNRLVESACGRKSVKVADTDNLSAACNKGILEYEISAADATK
jgi:hypothetical protein